MYSKHVITLTNYSSSWPDALHEACVAHLFFGVDSQFVDPSKTSTQHTLICQLNYIPLTNGDRRVWASICWWLNRPIWKICLSNRIISNLDRGENSSKMLETNISIPISHPFHPSHPFSIHTCDSFSPQLSNLSSFAEAKVQTATYHGSHVSHGKKVIQVEEKWLKKNNLFFSCKVSISNYCSDASWRVHNFCWKTKSLSRLNWGDISLVETHILNRVWVYDGIH